MTNFKEWLSDLGLRCIKTFGESLMSMITVGAALNELDWPYIMSCAVVSVIYTVAFNLAGIKVKDSKE